MEEEIAGENFAFEISTAPVLSSYDVHKVLVEF